MKNKLETIGLGIVIIGFGLTFQYKYLNEFPSHIHAWAQADRYALSLGFLENGLDFFKPQTYIYMSLASVLEAICQEYGIHSKADFIKMLEDDEEVASLADFARKSAAVAAERHVEQAAAEQATHVEEVLRLQMEIRTLPHSCGRHWHTRADRGGLDINR